MLIIYFVIKTHNFFIDFHIFLQNYREGKNDNNLQILHVRKIWMFGYQCEGLLHACISGKYVVVLQPKRSWPISCFASPSLYACKLFSLLFSDATLFL